MVFLKVFLTCSLFFNAHAFLESLFGHHGLHTNPDVFCIMEHCGKQSGMCLEDGNCRANMECMTKCGMTNHTCMYKCMNTYEDDVFDVFMKCLVDDFHCLKLQPPDPTFRCNPPTTAVKNFTLSQFEGLWYIVLGLNPDYDCFNCQLSRYEPTPNSRNYTLSEKYDVVMLNGSIRHRTTTQQVAQLDVFVGGKLDYTNHIMGLTMYEKWQVIDYADSGDYVIMYYCGQMTSDWWYEGSVIYSRQPTLSAEDTGKVAKVIHNALGHEITDYCRPKTDNCGSNGSA